jgi:thiol-disulfide isomerase/thioredoxin
MQKALVGFVVAGVVLVGGWYALSMGNGDEAKMMAEKEAMEKAVMEDKAMMEKAEMEKKAMEDNAMMDTEEGMVDKDESDSMMKKGDMSSATGDTMKKMGTYTTYDASKLVMADSGDVVLFFKAAWCPSCRAIDADIKANLSNIPASLTIMEVDYDASTALKQKYGVTTQHTFVQVDSQGDVIKKWSGGSTLASVVAQIN